MAAHSPPDTPVTPSPSPPSGRAHTSSIPSAAPPPASSETLVAIEPGPESSVTLYLRGPSPIPGQPGALVERSMPVEPFVLIADPALLEGIPVPYTPHTLQGTGAFRLLLTFQGPGEQSDALRHFRSLTGKTLADPDCPFAAPGDLPIQYLLRTGTRLFKDMPFSALHRMQLDLEVWYPDAASFPNAARASDRIVAIALSDSTGWEEVLAGRGMDEATLIQLAVSRIVSRDPDVLEGHNLFRFDLPYLEARAALHGVPLLLGRDGSRLRWTPARLKVGGRLIQHQRYRIQGRHVVDTMFLAMEFDANVLPMDGLSLKELARRFGVVPPDRTYIQGDQIRDVWKSDPERFLAYALDDVRETRGVSQHLLEPYFQEVQHTPATLQGLIARPLASRIELQLLGQYLQADQALPARNPGLSIQRQSWVDPIAGVHTNVLRLELRALPAALHLHRRMQSPHDPLGALQAVEAALIPTLQDTRWGRAAMLKPEGIRLGHARRLAEATTELLHQPGSFFSDAKQAKLLREALRELIGHFKRILGQQKARVLWLNETGGMVQLPPGQEGPEAGRALLDALTGGCPPGVSLALLDYHPRLLLQRDGQQAFLEDDQLVVVGTGLRNRAESPVLRALQEGMLRHILLGQPDEARALAEKTCAALRSDTLPLTEFVRRDSLRETLEGYRARPNPSNNRWAAFEAAIRAKLDWIEGEQVRWYISRCAGDSPTVPEHAAATLVSQHGTPETAIHTEWYVARIQGLVQKLEPFLRR